MAMVRALLYAPSIEALEAFILKSGRHAMLMLDTTTDILTFLRKIHDADVILLHHELPQGTAAPLTHWLNTTQMDKRAIIVNVASDPATIVQYYELGAVAYLLAGESASTLMDVLQLVADGVPRVDGKIGAEILRRVTELQAITRTVEKRPYPVHFEHHRYPVD